MASNRQDQILRFLVQAEGADALVPFLRTVKDLEGASDDTRKAADALLNQLSEATKLQAVAGQYERTQQAVEKLGQKAEAAKAKAAGLATELASTENPSKRQQEAFDRAAASSEKLAAQYENQKATLAILSAQLQVAGVNTADFAAAQADIAASAKAALTGLEGLAASAGAANKQTGILATGMAAAGKVIDGAKKAVDGISGGVKGLKVNLTELNQGLELAKKAFGSLQSVSAFLFDQVKAAGSLEDAMAGLQAVTNATAEEFALLKAAAVEATDRARVSSTQAAEGLTELARSGLSARDAIEVLNPALDLAQGNVIAVSQASELLTTSLKQFGEQADQATRFADVLQATADGTATSVEQLGAALSYAAPLANQAGLNIEKTAAIIGALADQGFRGERAGTALRNVFSSLSDPSSKFGQALREAGIESRDFATVIEELAKGGDRTKRALLALDAEARPAILALVNAGGTGIGALEQQLNSAAGTAERTSQILGGTFLAALTKAQNAIANARNSFLEPLLDPLQRELDLFTRSVNEFAKTDDFNQIAINFAKAVDQFIQDGKRLGSEIDFRGLLKDIKAFSENSVEKIQETTNAFAELTRYPLILSDAVQVGAAGIVESFAGVANDITEVGGLFSETSQNAAIFFDDIAQGARAIGDREFAQLTERLKEISGTVEEAKAATEGAAAAARQAAIDYQALAVSMLPAPVQALTQALIEAGVGLDDFSAKALEAKSAQDAGNESTQAGVKSAGELRQALADATIELDKANKAYSEAFAKGTDEAEKAWEAVKKAGQSVADLRKQLDAAQASATGLADAFDELGIQSQKSLQAAAERGKEAFEQITEAAQRGEAAQADVNRAFEQYARRLADVAATADDTTRRQILQQIELAARVAGVSSELLASATAGLQAGDAIESSGQRAAESWAGVKTEVRETRNNLEDAANVAEDSANRIAAAADKAADAQRNATGAARDAVEGLVAGTKEVEAYNDAMEQLIRRNEEFVARSLGVTVAQREINKERERAIEISREEIAVAQEAQAAGVAGGFGVGGGAGNAPDSTSSQTAAGGKGGKVELVIRNETTANAPTVRLANDQLDQLARKVLDALEFDQRAAGR